MTITKKPRGFAAMSKEKRVAIARKGGHGVPAEKRSFSTNQDLAKAAGRKGGSSVSPRKRSFSMDRALAARAGKKGGTAAQAGAKGKGSDGNVSE